MWLPDHVTNLYLKGVLMFEKVGNSEKVTSFKSFGKADFKFQVDKKVMIGVKFVLEFPRILLFQGIL